MASSPDDLNAWLDDYTSVEDRIGTLRSNRAPAGKRQAETPPFDSQRPASLLLDGSDASGVYVYHSQDGLDIGFVAAYEPARRVAWTYAAGNWAAEAWSAPTPLYDAHIAHVRDTQVVVVVRDEETAERIKALADWILVTTWFGRPEHADWAQLAGRQDKRAVLVIDSGSPDHDTHMMVVAAELWKSGYETNVIYAGRWAYRRNKPLGWQTKQLATLDEAVEFLASHEPLDQPAPPEPAPAPPPLRLVHDADILPPSLPPELNGAALEFLDAADRDNPKPERMGIDGWTRMGLELANGRPVPNVSNVSLVIGHAYDGEVWYDEFLRRIRTHTADRESTRDWTDADDIRVTIRLQREFGMTKVSKEIVSQGVIDQAYRHVHNELVDHLEALPPWDGTPRIEMFFIDCVGSKDTPYVRAVGRNFFTSLIARALRPGCKCDTMVILEGEQGAFKSTLIEALAGKWFATMSESPDNKDFKIALAGKWIFEIAELGSFRKADVTIVKRELSTSIDRYRGVNLKHAEDHPRMVVFVGSTNQSDYLQDETGARRFWPIRCRDIRIDLVRSNRDQLLAEAMAAFKDGATWWEVPSQEARIEQLQRYVGDPWSELVLEAAAGHTKLTVEAVMDYMKLDVTRRDRAAQMRVAAILKMAGYEKRTEWDGKTVRTWVKA